MRTWQILKKIETLKLRCKTMSSLVQCAASLEGSEPHLILLLDGATTEKKTRDKTLSVQALKYSADSAIASLKITERFQD